MIGTHTIACPQGSSSDASMFLQRSTAYFGPGRRDNSRFWTLMFKKIRRLWNFSLACLGSIHLGEGVLERHMGLCAVKPWSTTHTLPPCSGGDRWLYNRSLYLPHFLQSYLSPEGVMRIPPDRWAQMCLSWLFCEIVICSCCLQDSLSVIRIYAHPEMEITHNFEEYSGLGELERSLIALLAIPLRVYPQEF